MQVLWGFNILIELHVFLSSVKSVEVKEHGHALSVSFSEGAEAVRSHSREYLLVRSLVIKAIESNYLKFLFFQHFRININL